MLTAIAITPSAPVLVPELAGAAAAEVAEVRTAALTAAASLPRTWVAIGAGDADRTIASTSRGSYAGFGAEVPVSLGPVSLGPVSLGPDSSGPVATGSVSGDPAGPPVELIFMPPCALWAGWLRDHVDAAATVQVRVYDRDHDDEAAVRLGRELAADIRESPEPVGVLVVADGATTLTAAAPGGYDPDAHVVQQALDDGLATADPAALTGLPAAVAGRVAFAVLAGLAGSTPWSGRQLYRGAPYGVGYFVGVWTPSRPGP